MKDYYKDYYYERWKRNFDSCNVDLGLMKELEKKLEFGREKYKEISFQNSKKASLDVDIKQHAKEEIIDLMNYLNHMIVVRDLNGLPAITDELKELIIQCEKTISKIEETKLI